MAFFKKSEDPWDREPTSPVSRLEEIPEEPVPADKPKDRNSFREAAEKIEQEIAPDPIPCPWCGKLMEVSYLQGGRDGVRWQRTRPGFLDLDYQRIDTDGGFWNRYKIVWHCRDCGKLVMDFQPPAETPESRTQREYEDELRRYAEQANNREGEH